MSNPFDAIMLEAAEMVDISARMAEEEANAPECDLVVLNASVYLAKACKNLMLTAKKRAREVK